MPKLTERLAHAWNAFTDNDRSRIYTDYGITYATRPDRVRMTPGNEKSIINSVCNRIAIDVAAVKLVHAQLDQNGRYLYPVDPGLNEVLSVSANIDQTGRAFIQDVVMSMLDEGVVAIVPVDTTINPKYSGAFQIDSLRTGKIVAWHPKHVRVRLYNDKVGRYEEVTLPKERVSIIENPLYSVMNETNSTLQRLKRKLNILDVIDEQSGSGKLDLIIQLPYDIKTESRRIQAETRRKDIEMQLSGSKYGIAYTAATEKITQLNRSVENNLMGQIEYLTSMLYGQLGITDEVIKGTADDKTMLNYYNRTVEPILAAIADEMKRKFLTKTARTQNKSIVYFRDPFKLVPVSDLAEIADKFTRNEILSSNEVRGLIGYKPSDDPNADELRNKNIIPSDSTTIDDVEDTDSDAEPAMDISVSEIPDLANDSTVLHQNPMALPINTIV